MIISTQGLTHHLVLLPTACDRLYSSVNLQLVLVLPSEVRKKVSSWAQATGNCRGFGDTYNTLAIEN